MNIKKLKESPMFNLSLASKELFHSNFLDWMIREYKFEMSQLFSQIISNDVIIEDSKREKNNLDLFIKCQDEIYIVIENKFKSIITERQLVDYNQKLDKIKMKGCHKILLSLNDTSHEEEICKKTNWRFLDYSELAKKLKEVSISNPYHKSIIEDYCFFIEELSEYFKRDYKDYKLKDMDDEYKALLDIRLHDIYQKILFNYILKELTSKFENANLDYAEGFDFSKQISLWQDFWRGTGLISLNYTLQQGNDDQSRFRLELQLQYNHLKLMLIHPDPMDDQLDVFRSRYFKIIKELADSRYSKIKGEWFPKRKTKIQDYKSYGKNLIYKSIILSPELTILEVIELIYNTFEKVRSYGEKYKS